MNKELITIVQLVACKNGMDPAALAAFIEVESGGKGFDAGTGKILIQFEPAWMKKLAPYTPSGAWSVNKVDVQSREWTAFNDAFAKNQNAAMQATSIGLGQIMGFHYKRLGYASVGAMWDDAKKGLTPQVQQIAKFIATDAKLAAALEAKDWHRVAFIYNGAAYAQMAKVWKREPYNISLEKAYAKYSKVLK